jgi:hypothetical protein
MILYIGPVTCSIRKSTLSNDFKPTGKPKAWVKLCREYPDDTDVDYISVVMQGKGLTRAEAGYYSAALTKALKTDVKCTSNGTDITPKNRGDKRFVDQVLEALKQHFNIDRIEEG